MNLKLQRTADTGRVPFDLDFLRELGFKFGTDWDGELTIEHPETIDVVEMVELIMCFAKGIKQCLYFEGQKAKRVCVGGPCNGREHFQMGYPGQRIIIPLKRAQWAVYIVKSYQDPRAWYVGIASSKKKAKSLRAGKEKG